jgi:hypothetical protein
MVTNDMLTQNVDRSSAENRRSSRHAARRRQAKRVAVAEDVLHGERDRDAADAEIRDERPDIESELVEREEQRQCPREHAQGKADERKRRDRFAVGRAMLGDLPVHPAAHEAGRPDRRLDHERDD